MISSVQREGLELGAFPDVCAGVCKGVCCNPWWGFISYGIARPVGALVSVEREVKKGIEERAKRIIEAYVTKEALARPLFKRPERFSLTIRGMSMEGEGACVRVDLLLGLAFRCAFFSEGLCAIHPSALEGRDIRPELCRETGRTGLRQGQKGFCRIVHASESGESEKVKEALSLEKETVDKYYREGFLSPEEAATHAKAEIMDFCERSSPGPGGRKKAALPRNAPCLCGSGLKYKRCHGR
jgi:hypothetical protein